MHGQKDTTTVTMKAGMKLLTPDMMKVGMTAKPTWISRNHTTRHLHYDEGYTEGSNTTYELMKGDPEKDWDTGYEYGLSKGIDERCHCRSHSR